MLKKYQFQPNEIFNWDETGYIPGQGKQRKVVCDRVASNIATGGQAELITGIECIAADGWVMLPWFLVKGSHHLEEWYTSIDIEDFRIKPTLSWVNDETAIDWLCCFDEASKNRVTKGRPRLLLMDNHHSHCMFQFQQLCTENFIIPVWFVPHTTHLIQPLDGKAFQCLKHCFRRANNEEVMWGGSASTKRDFFRMTDAKKAPLQTNNNIVFTLSLNYTLPPLNLECPLRYQQS